MAAAQSILKGVVLGLQFCLGFWQIGKLTPLAGILRAFMAWLLRFLPFGLGNRLSPDYAKLRSRGGGIFKVATCFVPIAVDQTNLLSQLVSVRGNINGDPITWNYLGVRYILRRERDNMLIVDNGMRGYITDTIWSYLQYVKSESNNYGVFLKGYKEFWENVATGSIMSFSELLDCLVLDNLTFKRTDTRWLLPVNLSVSEEKLLKALNLLGLFLQTKNVHWLIPTLVSLVAAVTEFSTPLRVWIYGRINSFFCQTMCFLFDRLQSLSMRRQVYSLGRWVEKLKPSNDIQCRVVRGNIRALIGGGAKISQQGATPVQPALHLQQNGRVDFIPENIPCGDVITFSCCYSQEKARCDIEMFIFKDRTRNVIEAFSVIQLHCKRDEFEKVVELVWHMAQNQSGTIKYCEHNRVHVRGFEESVMCYVKSGYPPLYELQLNDVVVE